MMGGYYGDWWWMAIGAISMLVFWGATIGLIVWGARQFTRERHPTPGETPLEIAKRRLARGEITQISSKSWRRRYNSTEAKRADLLQLKEEGSACVTVTLLPNIDLPSGTGRRDERRLKPWPYL